MSGGMGTGNQFTSYQEDYTSPSFIVVSAHKWL